MSFVSFWKNTKNVICLFLEKNSKLNVFEKQVNLDLTLFGKKQKMSFVSFWNEPNVAAALMSTHFASVPDGRVRTVSKGECCRSPLFVSTTVGRPAPACHPAHQSGLLTVTVLRNPVLRNRGCHRFSVC